MLLDLKDLWVSNVILLSEVSSGPGRITVRSPLTSSFCQLETDGNALVSRVLPCADHFSG